MDPRKPLTGLSGIDPRSTKPHRRPNSLVAGSCAEHGRDCKGQVGGTSWQKLPSLRNSVRGASPPGALHAVQAHLSWVRTSNAALAVGRRRVDPQAALLRSIHPRKCCLLLAQQVGLDAVGSAHPTLRTHSWRFSFQLNRSMLTLASFLGCERSVNHPCPGREHV